MSLPVATLQIPSSTRQQELDAIEFPTVIGLLTGFAKTRQGRSALEQMQPWDGRAGLRRLRQMELSKLWDISPAHLPIVPFDQSLDQVLNPSLWPLPEHWRNLRHAMQALSALLKNIAGLTWPPDVLAPEGTHLDLDRLQIPASVLSDPAPIASSLQRTFNEDGELDPLRIPELAQAHRERARCFQAVQNKLQRLLSDSADSFQEHSIVERNGRYCLPVRTDRARSIPGLLLDRSSSGATHFIEPFEVVSLNNDHVEADRAYTQAVHAFLRDFLDQLRGHREDFLAWQHFLADVDEILALLRWRKLCDGELPILSENLNLLDAKHPLLLPGVRAAMDLDPLDHDVVSLNLELGADRPGLVISGSNTGGKTVVLKTVGLLCTLAQTGLAIPAKAITEIPKVSTLHADIGDHQTLVGSLSTFSSHIVHLRQILMKAKPGGLVLLDELGTGTDPKEGAALGIALLQTLSRRRCRVLCSTHLGEISLWALKHPKFQNASVQFDEQKLEPTYRLLVGQPGQSRALTIARRLGLPRFVLDLAEKTLGRREQDWREFLRSLEAERVRLQELESELLNREASIQKDLRILADREEKMRIQQEKFQRDGSEKLNRALDFIEHESKRLVKELKQRTHEVKAAADTPNPDRVHSEAQERIKLMEHIAKSEMGALKKTAPAMTRGDAPVIKLDGYARHRGLGVEGKVIRLKGDRVTLQTPQGRQLEARVGELEAIFRNDLDAPKASGRVKVSYRSEDIERELNLIGRASDDIQTEVHRFIEEAIATGLKFIRIVHGHGTGRLKIAVRECLKSHPFIQKAEDAPQSQGGSGATLITLK